MGNKQSKWFPETAWRGWNRHSDERYAQLSAYGSRPRSRKTSRKCVFLETIEEEWLISDEQARAQNSQELLSQDMESQMPPEAVCDPDVTQPDALMDPEPKKALVKLKRIQQANFDGQEQPYPGTVCLAEDLMLPHGSAWGKQKNMVEERVSCCFYNRAESENLEEAKIVKVTVWNADDLAPEDEAVIELEGHLFECEERATKEILPPAEHGMGGLQCEDEVLWGRDAKETDYPQRTDEEYPLELSEICS